VNETRYFIVGERPVKSTETTDGGLAVYAFNWDTHDFDLDMGYLTAITLGRDEISEVSEAEFDAAVRALST
jgi:hypothetical protein